MLIKYNCFPNLTVNVSLNRDLLYQQNMVRNFYKKETPKKYLKQFQRNHSMDDERIFIFILASERNLEDCSSHMLFQWWEKASQLQINWRCAKRKKIAENITFFKSNNLHPVPNLGFLMTEVFDLDNSCANLVQ